MSVIVVALGGNALEKKNEEANGQNQLKNIRKAVKKIADLIEMGHEVVISHGNGPQVGRLMLQNEAAKEITPPLTLDLHGASTQGMIGYHIQSALKAELNSRNIQKSVCTVITQVVVDANDKAFADPTKPVGPFYSQEQVKKLPNKDSVIFKNDSGKGYRRVVPSPKPEKIVEADVIKDLVDQGVIVVSTGGGGIPVIEEEFGYKGIEAVIDKDYASEILAEELNADILLILTGVKNVCINFGKKNEQKIHKISTKELINLKEQGHFYEGSMLPKVEAALAFATSKKGRLSIITDEEHACMAIKGQAGTIIEEEKE